MLIIDDVEAEVCAEAEVVGVDEAGLVDIVVGTLSGVLCAGGSCEPLVIVELAVIDKAVLESASLNSGFIAAYCSNTAACAPASLPTLFTSDSSEQRPLFNTAATQFSVAVQTWMQSSSVGGKKASRLCEASRLWNWMLLIKVPLKLSSQRTR